MQRAPSASLPVGAMKKTKRSQKTKKRAASQPAPATETPDRRTFLKNARNGAIALGVLGAASYFTLRSVQAHSAEHDLTRIGKGVPTVVQVHDPGCPMCRALQKEARAALKGIDDDRLLYLVADINSDAGRRLARDHSVPHVTLLLFDARGRVRDVLQGARSRADLQLIFEGHARPVS